ncbi:MAG: hypothetical protein GY838_04610 [bacterium]|nr:hypothetical protein [bacterium]
MRCLIILALLLVALPAVAQKGPADTLWELYQEGRFDEVVQQGKALLNTGTETAQVNLAVGRALADQDQCGEGIIYLERAAEMDLDRSWVYAWAQNYLGNCDWFAGREDAARRAWMAARDADATHNSTRQAAMNLVGFGLAESFVTWTDFTTDHFAFRFSGQLTDLDREVYARTHEEAFTTISTFFGGGGGNPIRFFVWADQEEATAAGMPPLGIAKPEYDMVHCVAAQTVGHEMTHVISHRALEPTARTGLINEGTAVHFDQTGRDQLARARRALAEARTPAGEPLPVVATAALWDDWSLLPGDVSYPVAGAWVAKLIEQGGKEKFLEFYSDQTLAHARTVYGDDLQGWLAEFDAALAD